MSSDRSINDFDEDLLGRRPFCERMVTDIAAIDAKDGAVIAFSGEWGTGKTSIINLVSGLLKRNQGFTVLEFNPWLYTDSQDLVARFLGELSKELNGSKKTELSKLLDSYALAVAPLSVLPMAGGFFSRSSGAASAWSQVLKRGKTLEKLRDELRGELAKLPFPILVVLDDIDRLRRDEVLEVLKLVRLTANFPQLIFLLAFDTDRLVQEIGDDDPDHGARYVEKIIDLKFDVPPPSEAALADFLLAGVQRLCDEESLQVDDSRWAGVFYSSIQPLFATLRGAKRYLSSVNAAVDLLRGEVDVVDVLALEAWRYARPTTYKHLLTESHWLTSILVDDDGHRAQIDAINRVLNEEQDSYNALRGLIRYLFPAGDKALDGGFEKMESLAIWRRAKRVAHPDVLSAYMTLVLPDYSIPFAVFEDVVSGLTNTSALQVALSTVAEPWIMDLLVRIIPYVGRAEVRETADRLEAFLGMYSLLPDARSSPTDPGPSMVLDQVVKQCMLQLSRPLESGLVAFEVLSRDISFTGKSRLLRIILEEPLLRSRIDEGELQAALHRMVAEFHDASVEAILDEPDLLFILRWMGDLMLVGSLEVDERLSESRLVGAAIRNAVHEVELPLEGTSMTTATPILDYEDLLLLLGGEGGLAEAIRSIEEEADAKTAPLDESIQRVIHLANLYLTGYRPFPVLDTIERTNPVVFPSQQLVYWDQGPEGPSLILRSSTSFSVALEIAKSIELRRAQPGFVHPRGRSAGSIKCGTRSCCSSCDTRRSDVEKRSASAGE